MDTYNENTTVEVNVAKRNFFEVFSIFKPGALKADLATLPGDKNIPVPIIEFIVKSTIDQNPIFFLSIK